MIGIEGAALGFGLLLILLALGLHIATALIAVAALGSWWFFGDAMFRPFGVMMWACSTTSCWSRLRCSSSWAKCWCAAA